jgi:hypothetical protein
VKLNASAKVKVKIALFRGLLSRRHVLYMLHVKHVPTRRALLLEITRVSGAILAASPRRRLAQPGRCSGREGGFSRKTGRISVRNRRKIACFFHFFPPFSRLRRVEKPTQPERVILPRDHAQRFETSAAKKFDISQSSLLYGKCIDAWVEAGSSPARSRHCDRVSA